MALINCRECGGQISDKAKICIHCGATVNIKTGSLNVILNVILFFVSALIFPLTWFVCIRYAISLLYTILFSIILWLIIIFPVFLKGNKRK